MRSRAVNNDQSRLDDKELNNDIEEAEIDAPGSSRQNSIIPIVTFLHAYPLELLLPHPVRLSGQNFFEEKISHFLFQECGIYRTYLLDTQHDRRFWTLF
jgi:hypothetical protein